MLCDVDGSSIGIGKRDESNRGLKVIRVVDLGFFSGSYIILAHCTLARATAEKSYEAVLPWKATLVWQSILTHLKIGDTVLTQSQYSCS